jgi:hypothetical protein
MNRERQNTRQENKGRIRLETEKEGYILFKSDKLIKDSESKRQTVKRKRRIRRQKVSKEVSQ